MEAIVGLGIIEAFSYVLLYYTFIHSLNRYEKKGQNILYCRKSGSGSQTCSNSTG